MVPIYEYRCKKCGELFALMRPVSKADARTRCTSCSSTAVRRQLSRFAVVGAGDDAGGGDDLDMGDDDFGDFDDDW